MTKEELAMAIRELVLVSHDVGAASVTGDPEVWADLMGRAVALSTIVYQEVYEVSR